MKDIRLDGRVAIVTGAGRGLGRSHALMLAARGASVVVNDPGEALTGGAAQAGLAQQVADEITAAGGAAVADAHTVATADDARALVQTALDAFGRVDVLVNNAGILRDVSFHKMTMEQWRAVVDVHLFGTAAVTHAAWPHLRARGYGRVVNTTSAAGLYGNFGQANYSAAKMGIVGLTKTLAQEGAKYGIQVNVIAPVAKSRMTETILPPQVLARLSPSLVSPLVVWLACEACETSGQIYAVGGGYVSRVAVVEGPGVVFSGDLDPEAIAARWDAISDLTAARPFDTALDAARQAIAASASGY